MLTVPKENLRMKLVEFDAYFETTMKVKNIVFFLHLLVLWRWRPGKLFRCFELAQLTEGGLGRSNLRQTLAKAQ